MQDFSVPANARQLEPGMGQAVAERTYLRKVLTDAELADIRGRAVAVNPKQPNFEDWVSALTNSGKRVVSEPTAPLWSTAPETRWETWGELAQRVAIGNVSLMSEEGDRLYEYNVLAGLIGKAAVLMSGRHLQHGDARQSERNMEVFTNCATCATSFGLFKLLLNGAGVGRDYSDGMMVVDWDNMPMVVPAMSEKHPDFVWGKHTSVRDARHLYAHAKKLVIHKVADSREGWAKAIEIIEMMTFGGNDRETVLIIDFSDVRECGRPIMGMQGRPSSGPAPLIDAIEKVGKIRGAGLPRWLQTLYIDHFLAESVLVGGARRAARMSTKWWQDTGIIEFISAKRPIEYDGLTMDEVIALLAETGEDKPEAFLWSSNNSITVDADFWTRVKGPITSDPLTMKAKMVFEHATRCGYGDGTGEPGFINVDRLNTNSDGFDDEAFINGEYFQSMRYTVEDDTMNLLRALVQSFVGMPYQFITNPCGEVVLSILGGFCVIGDVVPFHCDDITETFTAVEATTRALMRVNTMNSVYGFEVNRTQRIGVGLTGVHEAAWKFFTVGFNDLINPNFELYETEIKGDEIENLSDHVDPRVRAAAFWEWLGKLSRHVNRTAVSYAEELGVTVPHTMTTVKPSGTVSKLFGLTEGWHLPAMAFYVRWVQYHATSPLVQGFRDAGYEVRDLVKYRDHVIVGFPTSPIISALVPSDHLVVAGEASMDDQFTWLELGEFFWLDGGRAEVKATGKSSHIGLPAYGNQISYTMKYLPGEVNYQDFAAEVLKRQPGVRCCAMMPQTNITAHEYLPEQSVTKAAYEEIVASIRESVAEDVSYEHVSCDNGACPVIFDETPREVIAVE